MAEQTQPQKIEAKFSFAGDFNEIYVTAKGSHLAIVDGKWHKCTGSPWYEPDYPINNKIVIVKEFSNGI